MITASIPPTRTYPSHCSLGRYSSRAIPLISGLLLFAPAAITSAAPATDLANLSIEQLMGESVTSVAKKEIRLGEAPAAIAVVTPDDVRTFGITTIPEALRFVPGMEVARISANEWAVSSRGFNNQFATKLLVLIDGQSIYTPASAGVFWNAQDVVMEDLDRIEVIRGSGSTLWGSNAVNGVINITTKSAKETQGSLVSVVAGTEEKAAATVRYGGKIGSNLYYRVYAKHFERSGFEDPARDRMPDAWNTWHGGARVDWLPSADDTLTFQSDFYRGEAGKRVFHLNSTPLSQTEVDATEENSGTNLLGRWTHRFSPTSSLTLQTYYDRVKQGDGFGIGYLDTLDFDLQHRFALGDSHDFVWGLGYRESQTYNTSGPNLSWDPERHRLPLSNLFAQDDIALVRNRVFLTLGSKFEHNEFTGWAIQPSARVRWTPSDRQTFWTAVSRADRTPAVFERAGRLNVSVVPNPPPNPPVVVGILGNPIITDEKLDEYEIGYRIEPSHRLSFDLATFYNEYQDLIAPEAQAPHFEFTPSPPHLLVPLPWTNVDHGHTVGAELTVQWRVNERWRLAASYTALSMNLAPDPTQEYTSPHSQVQLRSVFNVTPTIELTTALYSASAIAAQTGASFYAVPAFVRTDFGLVWHPTPAIELGIWGQNLGDPHHPEFASQTTETITEVPRTFLTRLTWRF